jgi:uncharacterized protein
MHQLLRVALFLLVLGAVCLALIIVLQRKLLYFPSHHPNGNGLAEWRLDGELAGYARQVARPKNVWLFLHGNAGQASDRIYALHCFADQDAVYFLEYPGYGSRPGSPGRASINAAAEAGYRWLRSTYPGVPVCVAGESIGSGPASHLARQEPQPDKIVLVVPFDNLASVAQHHFPFLPARLLLFDRWDNVAALKGFRGMLEIFAAGDDRIIPASHAKTLAQSHPGSDFLLIPGGHNDWSVQSVSFRH